MNTRTLRILAVVLAVGAVLIAYWGYRLNRQQVAVQHADGGAARGTQSAGAAQAVVAVHGIAPGHVIVAGDVKLAPVPAPPEGSMGSLAEVLGKAPDVPVAAGETLGARHFIAASALARAVSPGERAVAIRVDEVVAGGGFVQAGDHVDVLLYLRGNAEMRATSAQVVLHHVRVLAYGDNVGPKTSAVPGVAPRQDSGAVKSRAAVLAVPAADTARLMLAASAGDLRLAVYGAQESQTFAASDTRATRELVTLPELGPGAPIAAAAPRNAASTRASGITIYRGTHKEVAQ